MGEGERKGGWERGGRREIEEEEGEGRVGKGESKGERAKMEGYVGQRKYWSGRQKQVSSKKVRGHKWEPYNTRKWGYK